jgi:hypothetical protein
MRLPFALLAVLAVAGGTAFTASASSGSGSSGANPKLFLGSSLDVVKETITLPLYEGRHAGQAVWYVVTDSSSEADAERRGVNEAPKLANALGTKAVQNARIVNGRIDFPGTVDFSPARVVEPGPTGFPPAVAKPGAVGDADYSPYVSTNGRTVLNATQVANASGLHDSVVAIDYANRRVTMSMFFGFWHGHKILYLHQDASDEVTAALEGSTFAPNMNAAPGVASNDSDTSARSAILPVVNGERGKGNPERQGLNSAVFGEGDPLNITQELPGSGGDRYTPVWDIHPIMWTAAAIAAGERERLTSDSEVRNAFDDGLIVSAASGPANESLEGLRAAGSISNCPIVARF